MKQITSSHNLDVKKIISLKTHKGRTTHKLFIAEGLRTCLTLIQAGLAPINMYLTDENQAKKFSSLPITLVNDTIMKRISTLKTPSGILGVFPITSSHCDMLVGPGLVLVNLSDPGNMGTLIRTAAAFNVKTIVVIEGVDPWNPKVIQATAGAIGMVNLYCMSWQELKEKKHSLHLIALVTQGGKKPQKFFNNDSLLIVGSEAHGISQTFLDDCDAKITIAMPGNTESLNVAVAGSIALYNFLGL